MALFLGMMWCFGIVDSEECEAHAITGAGGLSDHGYEWLKKTDDIDVGTGPYKVKKFTLLQKYDLELIDDYWGGPPELNLPYPSIKYITMLAITEDADARMRLLRGELNVASDLQPDTVAALDGAPGVKTDLSPGNTYQQLRMHCWGITKDWRVRQAIYRAIDYDEIVNDVMLGAGSVSQGLFIPGQPGWEKTAEYYPGGSDPAEIEKANALLDEAGYPWPEGGWRFQLECEVRPAPRYGCNYINLASVFQQQMRKIGIDIVITVYEVGEWYRRNMDMSVATGVPDLLWIQPGHYPILTDPGYDVIGFQSEGAETAAFNTYGWNSTTQGLDPEGSGLNMWVKQNQMYEEVQAERDWDERIRKWQELDEYLLQYGPQVKMICSQFTSAYTDNVENFFCSPLNIWPAIFWMEME